MAQDSREMKKKKVIDVLNKARAMGLYALHQYMNQHYNLDDMDYGDLVAKVKLIAIDKMRHAEMFAERIKELGGEPTTDVDGKVTKAQKVDVVFPFDAYNKFLLVCRENGDSVSMKLFETITEEEQAHFNYFDNVTDHLKKLGAAYLAQIAGTPAELNKAIKVVYLLCKKETAVKISGSFFSFFRARMIIAFGHI